MSPLRAPLLAALLCLAAGPAQAEERSLQLAGLDVTVWSRQPAPAEPQPVVIFSHGFHGCATQSRFLMEALADAGYLVLAPNHKDATCNGGGASWRDGAELPFRDPQRWDETTYRERGEDIHRLVETLRTDETYRTRADLTRLALAGHSLGGYTVLGLAGAWPGWKLKEVKAVLALSPYSQPFLVKDTLGGLAAPVMYQGGTLDIAITPALQRSGGAYERSPEPKYLVELDRAGHFAWADLGLRSAHEPIVAYSLAFLDHHVKGEAADPVLTRVEPSVSQLRYASDVGRGELRSERPRFQRRREGGRDR